MKQTLYAVPLTGSDVFHLPGTGGFPACMESSPPEVYVVDRVRRLHYLLVPKARRCTDPGCADRWSR